jgi:2-methylcitrate dehydratase PrpD
MAIAPRPGAAASASSALTRLAGHCLALDTAAQYERAALRLLDWLGNAAYGATHATGLVFARWLALQGAGAVPTLAGRAADAAAAAAYHGALGSTLEMDDVHRSSILHPGPVVVPAVLAAAPAATSGVAVLRALVIGYEATIRIGRALGPSHYRLWHSTATAGAFGAAAGAAAVLSADLSQLAHAMALAGTRAGGLWQVRHEDSLGKTWHMAGAAREGLAAAQLAQVGVTGPLAVLEGPSGWFTATAPEADLRRIDETRATPWIDDVSFKPWPACRHAHPAMDAFAQALGTAPVATSADDLERIDVHTYDDALRFCDRPEPKNEWQARFSIQHALAAWACWGEPQLAHYEAAALGDARVARLRERVRLTADAAFSQRFPEQYGAQVVLHWRDGTQTDATLHDTRGDPARPLAPAAVEAKARMLMSAAGWPAARIDAAVAACMGLPQARDLQALHRVLMKP